MKDEKNGSPDKPFYQNILDQRKRRSEKPGKKAARAGAGGVPPTASPAPAGKRPPRADEGAARPDFAPRRPYARFTPSETGTPVFAGLSAETQKLLEGFPELAQSVMPLDSRKLHQLPADIRSLSHELTDERSERRVGYMNEPPVLSAYIRYYMWWNLVRLTRLFSGLSPALDDGDAAVDLGSGPLTLPIALWMARPELRSKKIVWYCVDLSQNALSAGEELFLSLAAKTGHEPWQIIRIKGELGVSLRRRVRLVASANMFNELFWDDPDPIEAQAKRHARSLASYAEDRAAVLLIEPGVPLAGRFVSLMRDSLMRLDFMPASPCPHEGVCPFAGLRGGKWCHFVFDTADAPKALHALSDEAGLSKDRAALSFVYAVRDGRKAAPDESAASEDAGEPADVAESVPSGGESTASAASDRERVSALAGRFGALDVRVASDPIRLPDYRTGRYGCSELGMVLVTGSGPSGKWLSDEAPGAESGSGALLRLPRPAGRYPRRDEKSGALLIELDGGAPAAERGPRPGNAGTRNGNDGPRHGNDGPRPGNAGRGGDRPRTGPAGPSRRPGKPRSGGER